MKNFAVKETFDPRRNSLTLRFEVPHTSSPSAMQLSLDGWTHTPTPGPGLRCTQSVRNYWPGSSTHPLTQPDRLTTPKLRDIHLLRRWRDINVTLSQYSGQGMIPFTSRYIFVSKEYCGLTYTTDNRIGLSILYILEQTFKPEILHAKTTGT